MAPNWQCPLRSHLAHHQCRPHVHDMLTTSCFCQSKSWLLIFLALLLDQDESPVEVGYPTPPSPLERCLEGMEPSDEVPERLLLYSHLVLCSSKKHHPIRQGDLGVVQDVANQKPVAHRERLIFFFRDRTLGLHSHDEGVHALASLRRLHLRNSR